MNLTPIFKRVRKWIPYYAGIMLVVLIASLLFHTSKPFRTFYTQTLFSINKPVMRIDAAVLGYSSQAYGGGRRGPAIFNYRYGFTYKIGDRSYYGTGYAAVSEPGDYSAFKPLPRTFTIYVNRDNPGQFTYITGHYGLRSWVNVPVFIYLLFLGFLCGLYFYSRREDAEIRLSNFKDYMAAIMAILLTIAPLSIAFASQKNHYHGQKSQDVTGYIMLRKHPEAFYKKNEKIAPITMDIENRNSANRKYRIYDFDDL
ncbi:MAG: hypothetical protein ACRCY3_02765, partial [Sphingorhabdus sp.]